MFEFLFAYRPDAIMDTHWSICVVTVLIDRHCRQAVICVVSPEGTKGNSEINPVQFPWASPICRWSSSWQPREGWCSVGTLYSSSTAAAAVAMVCGCPHLPPLVLMSLSFIPLLPFWSWILSTEERIMNLARKMSLITLTSMEMDWEG